MKILLCLLLFSFFSVSAQNYIFFLHNRFIEEYGLEGIHPEYGKSEYKAIIDKFKKEGFEVISEIRPTNAVVQDYAEKTVKQIDSLIKKGIDPSNITIVGTSKGGYIAMYVSNALKNRALNFVFIGCCNDEITGINFYGNILSIYEKSDEIGRSCKKMKEISGDKINKYKEMELNTGMKHGFLYKALDVWMKPSIQWAKRIY